MRTYLLEEILIGEEPSHGNKVKGMLFHDDRTTNPPKPLFVPEIIFPYPASLGIGSEDGVAKQQCALSGGLLPGSGSRWPGD